SWLPSLLDTVTGSAVRCYYVYAAPGTGPTPPSTVDLTSFTVVDSVPAEGRDRYVLAVPAPGDSGPAGVSWQNIVVVAEPSSGGTGLSSPAECGYPRDTMSPFPADAISGTKLSNGSEIVEWPATDVPDFATFRVYRGDSADFALDLGHLVAQTPDTNWTDVDPSASPWYKVTTVDEAGNESPPVTLA